MAPGQVFYWKVRTWNNGSPAPYSEIKAFKMAGVVAEYGCARYPLEKTDEQPVVLKNVSPGLWFVDFGKDGFGRLRITLSSDKADTISIRL